MMKKTTKSKESNVQRRKVELAFADEIMFLVKEDNLPKPEGWIMSPQAVVLYILGGESISGKKISPKYFGDRSIVELAVATLATDRALLLAGVPGTAKTWLSEHLAAAISGKSDLLVQGTAGMPEDQLRYGWNYASLLSHGPSLGAVVASPVMQAMTDGNIVRVEELTRIPSDIQDTLITILSERALPIPEINHIVEAVRGFNLIATANTRDKGVNELSSALQRRFNTVIMPLPSSIEKEVEIVRYRIEQLQENRLAKAPVAPMEEIVKLVTIFRELREGKTIDGRVSLKSPSVTLSTAEAISVLQHSLSMSQYFGNGKLSAAHLALGIKSAIVKDSTKDKIAWQEYIETVIKGRVGWESLFEALENK